MNKLIISINIGIIKFYQYFLSPILAGKCRYLPSCSEYYIESLKKHGLYEGTFLGLKRIFSCHPFKILGGGSDYDFVPNHTKKNRGK